MSQHHDGAEEKCGWVGKTLSGDIRCGTMDSLKNRALVANVGGWCKAEATDKSSAGIGQDISIKVGHNQHLVVIWRWVCDNLQASVIDKLSIEFNAWEVLGDPLSSREEKAIAHLHDGCLVDCADLWFANLLGILKSVSADTL